MTDDTLTPEQVAQIRSRDLFYLTMKETTALCDTVDTLRKRLGEALEDAVPGPVALGFHADVLRLLGVESSAQATDKIRRLTDALLAINESDVRHSTRAWMRAVVRRALAETGGE